MSLELEGVGRTTKCQASARRRHVARPFAAAFSPQRRDHPPSTPIAHEEVEEEEEAEEENCTLVSSFHLIPVCC